MNEVVALVNEIEVWEGNGGNVILSSMVEGY